MAVSPTAVPAYRERLLPGPGGWCAGIGLGIVMGLVVWPASATVGAVIAVVACCILIAALYVSSPVIVVDDELRAGKAHIPVSLIGEPTPLDGAEMSAQLGTLLDARAHVCLRSWARRGIRVQVLDPSDPTPYWLVSTRRPDRLCAAIAARRTGAQHPAE